MTKTNLDPHISWCFDTRTNAVALMIHGVQVYRICLDMLELFDAGWHSRESLQLQLGIATNRELPPIPHTSEVKNLEKFNSGDLKKWGVPELGVIL